MGQDLALSSSDGRFDVTIAGDDVELIASVLLLFEVLRDDIGAGLGTPEPVEPVEPVAPLAPGCSAAGATAVASWKRACSARPVAARVASSPAA